MSSQMVSFKEFIELENPPEIPEYVQEALSLSQRRKAAQRFKRIKGKLKRSRQRAKKRTANLDTIKSRAKKQARNTLFKKLSRGKARTDVSPSVRNQIEKRMAKFKSRLDRDAKRLIPKVRKDDRKR